MKFEKQQKRPFVTKMYKKTVTNVKDMVSELINVHEEIDYILVVENNVPEDLGHVLENIISYVLYKAPNLKKMENMKTSFSLKPNKLFLQTNSFIGFGWYIKYNKAEDRKSAEITEIEMEIVLYGARSIDETEPWLLDHDWTVCENTK